MFKKILCYLKHFTLKDFLILLYKQKINKSITKIAIHNKDFKYPIYLRSPSSDVSIYKQIFIDQEYNCILKKSPEIIVDAGANIGLSAIYFAKKYPKSKILAIEPEINNFNLLKENTAKYKNIVPIQAALWNKNTKISIANPEGSSCAFITKEDKNSKKSNKVQAITVDKIIKDYKLKQIDILKIDIEGAEKEVFEDTSKWINKVNCIAAELHDRFKPGCSRSFYNGTNGFKNEMINGENIFLSRNIDDFREKF